MNPQQQINIRCSEVYNLYSWITLTILGDIFLAAVRHSKIPKHVLWVWWISWVVHFLHFSKPIRCSISSAQVPLGKYQSTINLILCPSPTFYGLSCNMQSEVCEPTEFIDKQKITLLTWLNKVGFPANWGENCETLVKLFITDVRGIKEIDRLPKLSS